MSFQLNQPCGAFWESEPTRDTMSDLISRWQKWIGSQVRDHIYWHWQMWDDRFRHYHFSQKRYLAGSLNYAPLLQCPLFCLQVFWCTDNPANHLLKSHQIKSTERHTTYAFGNRPFVNSGWKCPSTQLLRKLHGPSQSEFPASSYSQIVLHTIFASLFLWTRLIHHLIR